jgi:hypothetical protein
MIHPAIATGRERGANTRVPSQRNIAGRSPADAIWTS